MYRAHSRKNIMYKVKEDKRLVGSEPFPGEVSHRLHSIALGLSCGHTCEMCLSYSETVVVLKTHLP